MVWAKPDLSLTRGVRRRVVRHGPKRSPSDVTGAAEGSQAFNRWCPVCEALQGANCMNSMGGDLDGFVHQARADIGLMLSEPQEPKETPMPFRHKEAERYGCPYCLMPVGRQCYTTPGSPESTHLARVALSEVAAANEDNLTGDDSSLLCCYDVGGGGVCELAGKSVGNGLAYCYQHWSAGRVEQADRGGLMCEAEDCHDMATVHAGKRAAGGHRFSPMAANAESVFWCDAHTVGKSSRGYTIRKLKYAT